MASKLRLTEPQCPVCHEPVSSSESCRSCLAIFNHAEKTAIQNELTRIRKWAILQLAMSPQMKAQLRRQRITNEMDSDRRVGGMLSAAGAVDDNPYAFSAGLSMMAEGTARGIAKLSGVGVDKPNECNPAMIRAAFEKLGVAEAVGQPVQCHELNKSLILDVFSIAQQDGIICGLVKLKRNMNGKVVRI